MRRWARDDGTSGLFAPERRQHQQQTGKDTTTINTSHCWFAQFAERGTVFEDRPRSGSTQAVEGFAVLNTVTETCNPESCNKTRMYNRKVRTPWIPHVLTDTCGSHLHIICLLHSSRKKFLGKPRPGFNDDVPVAKEATLKPSLKRFFISGTTVTVKTATLTASKPAKPVKMSATHQNSSKVAANPAAKVAKPSGRNSESPKKSPKKPAPAGDSKPKHTEASPAAKVKPPGELSKSDSRKAMVLDVQKVVEPPVVEPEVSRQSSAAKLAPAGAVDKKQDTGTHKSTEIPPGETVVTEQPKPKAPLRQSSAAKLPTGAGDKAQEQHNQKVASETSLPTQREEPAGAGKTAEAAKAKMPNGCTPILDSWTGFSNHVAIQATIPREKTMSVRTVPSGVIG
ncbi:unnamed protein product [Heligmosomoides polygyrus]|uniref:HTH_48 domain-containing protein n=1 Tax=Heligmosomoides polygyrus TaxID=6339 RepID=A0A3P8DVI1_HELPZ|nr:unnamed protein product [Heligmosomoides polygyrus]